MINDLRYINKKHSVFGLPITIVLSVFFILSSLFSFAQVTSSIDSTSIKIGEQITYRISKSIEICFIDFILNLRF